MPARHARRALYASVAAGSVIVAMSAATPATSSASSAPAAVGHMSSSQASKFAKGKRTGVIVMLKNQHPNTPDMKATRQARSTAVKHDQSPYLSELKQVAAGQVKSYTIVNGFAAQVTAAEAARLATDPNVASVSPQRTYSLPRVDTTPVASKASNGSSASSRARSGVCPADPSKPLLEPEALQLSHTAYNNPATPQAQNIATGKGVKIAFLADGLDINNPDFIRPDGSHVIVDYQNFSGLGNTPTDGEEAFGDASSLAAQGRVTYDLSNYADPAAPLPPGCTIKIRGMAPDASLVAINLSPAGSFTDSTILEGIDYAASQNVDIINESLGGLGLPSTVDSSVIKANDAAVADGITVVASTGDEGTTGTVGSPALDQNIIAAGGSTAFRALAQASWGGFQLSNGKWYSNNISTFASGGTTEQGRVPDLVAPAERGWVACSLDTADYTGCVTRAGKPTNVFPFGGTSESSPLISGEAALVIQAYEQTHHGAHPSPALVKHLLTSTATDLDEPSSEQGAGLFNSLAAVRAAQSVHDGNGSPAAQSNALLLGKSQLIDSAPAGSGVSDSFTVTNTSASSQTVNAHGRALTTTTSDDHGTVTLNGAQAGLPTFFDGHFNDNRAYIKRTFTVPKGAAYLATSIAYPATGARPAEPQFTLLDPNGTFAAESYTSAGSGFGRADVHNPLPGTWTEAFSTAAGAGGFNGQITFDNLTQKYQNFGSVSPASLTLGAGQTGTFHVSVTTGAAAGDLSAAIQLDASSHVRAVEPFTVRSDITVTHDNGKFTGTLSGANGGSQYKAYYVDVPAGQRDMSLGVKFQNPNQVIFAAMVDPSGQPLGLTGDVFTDNAGNQSLIGALQFFRMHPTAGRWTLVVQLQPPANGTQTSTPFSGQLQFNTLAISATGLPNSAHTTLHAGTPTTATVTVKNTGNSPELFFADGRLDGQAADMPLISVGPSSGLPLGNAGGGAQWSIPTQTSSVTFNGSSTTPIQLDAGFFSGDPTYYGPPGAGDTASVTINGSELAPGAWGSDATIFGPTGSTVHSDKVNLTASAHTELFDPGFAAATGDIWQAAVDASAPAFNPITIQPGQTGTITVTLTPSAAHGTVVHGTLYVDDYSPATGDGDEMTAIPYTYTVG
jgi:Subtilase family/Peptidase inhibitor I9